MSTGPVEQILFRSAVAAVNSDSHLRVYSQDVQGNIRESLYEGKWSNGTIKNVIARGKPGSPIAACSKALNEIRVYYVSDDNKLREHCYSVNRGWYAGGLNEYNFIVAPYSKAAACFLAVGSALELRVYVQSPDNTIQEYGYTNGKTGWQKMTNLGPALTGSEIATISYKTTELQIRTYFQDVSRNIIEKAYDNSSGWFLGAFSVKSAIPRTCLAACSFPSSSDVSLRVYYGAANNRLLEKCIDGADWYDGSFSQPTIPGPQAAIITWDNGTGLNLRVYFQNGTDVTGISEWVYNGKWSQGVSAIPPA